MTSRRVLVPLTYGFSVRYAHPTGLLDRLAEVCDPVVGLGWQDDELHALLAASGHEVVRLPTGRMSHSYRNHARRMDLIHERRLASSTTRIRRARWKRRGFDRRRLIEETRNLRDQVASRRPGGALTIAAEDDRVLRDETNLAEFSAFLERQRVDGVLSFTPYHDQDVLALVAARDLGRRTIVSIISFDNPTIRGRLVVRPDRVLVWNRFNQDEVLRSHPTLESADVAVVGAPQFDLHRQKRLVVPEKDWRDTLGLPADRPVILYGAGPSRLVPEEHRLVELLDRAISDGRLPGDPFLLVRRHPVDPADHWAERSRGLRNALVAAPWASNEAPMRSWPSIEDLQMQMSSLAHSVVHVNVCSSMTVDGAMFDRPQVGPAFLPGAGRLQQRFVRDFYGQEHWQPIDRSGGLALAWNEEELVREVRTALRDPDSRGAGRQRLLAEVLSWPDGASSRRLVEQVTSVLDG